MEHMTTSKQGAYVIRPTSADELARWSGGAQGHSGPSGRTRSGRTKSGRTRSGRTESGRGGFRLRLRQLRDGARRQRDRVRAALPSVLVLPVLAAMMTLAVLGAAAMLLVLGALAVLLAVPMLVLHAATRAARR